MCDEPVLHVREASGVFASADPCYSWVYPLPTAQAYKTVNGAVFYTLARLTPTQPFEPAAVDGGTVYDLQIGGRAFQLFVLHLSDRAASIRVHPLAPVEQVGPEACWQPVDDGEVAQQGLAVLMALIHAAIKEQIGQMMQLDALVPPPPPATDLEAALLWQDLYYPTMTDRELADRIGVAHQSIRNARSKARHKKRIPRGVPRGRVRA
jgi:hypothetical protein